MVERFISALTAGDEQELLNLLAPDALLVSDGGGKVRSVINPLRGAQRIVRFFRGLLRKYPGRFAQTPATVNSGPGFVTLDENRLSSVTELHWDGRRITQLSVVLNPEKLRTRR
jgi:RNA polymerase sigma-70 factor (ECF subfamily)